MKKIFVPINSESYAENNYRPFVNTTNNSCIITRNDVVSLRLKFGSAFLSSKIALFF